MYGRQLLSCFGRKALNAVVVIACRDADVLQTVHLFGYLSLALYVAAILDSDFSCLDDFFAPVVDGVEEFFQFRNDFL